MKAHPNHVNLYIFRTKTSVKSDHPITMNRRKLKKSTGMGLPVDF